MTHPYAQLLKFSQGLPIAGFTVSEIAIISPKDPNARIMPIRNYGKITVSSESSDKYFSEPIEYRELKEWQDIGLMIRYDNGDNAWVYKLEYSNGFKIYQSTFTFFWEFSECSQFDQYAETVNRQYLQILSSPEFTDISSVFYGG